MIDVISGCVIWIPLAIWAVAIVHWMVGGDVDFVTGVMALGVGVGLGITAQRPPIPILSPIALFLVVAGIVLYPFLNTLMNQRQLRSLDVETVARAYRMLGQRPDNPLAKVKLAESIYRLGMIGHAVSIADAALMRLPERVAHEEHRTLKRWKYAGVPPETLKPIACVECHTPCLPGWTHCRMCGAQFLLDRAKGRIPPSGSTRKVLAGWVVLAGAVVGLPYATTLSLFPGLILVAGIILAGVGVLILAFRTAEGSIA